MKHFSLLAIGLLSSVIINSTQAPQSSPAATTSWWDRSKNYATSWVPESIKFQARTLSRSINDNLNPMRMRQLFREKIIIAKKLSTIMDEKIKNPHFDMSPDINNLMQLVSARAIELDFDPNKMIEDGINYRYAIIMEGKHQLAVNARRDGLFQNKYAMSAASKAKNKPILDSYRKKLKGLNLEKDILYEIVKITRATDLTKINQSPRARL